jgi:hypothetical protein
MNLNDMWDRLAQHQPYADARGYGPEWAVMCEQRTVKTAEAAAEAAAAAARAGTAEAWPPPAAAAAWAADAAALAEAWAAKAVKWIDGAEGEK